jgi:hypothetical protein
VKLRLTTVLILAQLCGAAFIHAQPANKEHWVATWTTAQLLARDQPAPPPAAAPPPPAGWAREVSPTRPCGGSCARASADAGFA